jgi:hypothetical protein
MAEVQAHGFSFEKWVRDQFFAAYGGSYMQKWDVPSDHNLHPVVPEGLRGLPVSIKTAKLGSPVGLGDVLRQRQIDHDFLMIVGFWAQRTPTEKWFVDIGCALFRAADWDGLWGRLTLAEIAAVDAVVKNQGTHYAVVRAEAQKWKQSVSRHGCTLVINPKIDSKTQRRIQCSLPYDAFWSAAGRAPQKLDAPELWGRVFPNPIISAARTFNRRLPVPESLPPPM